MPKCAMTFNLPEERNEMLIAQRGIDFYCVILEIKKIIREHHRSFPYPAPIFLCKSGTRPALRAGLFTI